MCIYTHIYIYTETNKRHNVLAILSVTHPAIFHILILNACILRSVPYKKNVYGVKPIIGVELILIVPVTGWCPPVISWFINPINYSYICHKP